MNFIGEINNLTLPQIQEYLSGKKPFPGGQMALAAHLPALAAAATRMNFRDGGGVPQIDDRMQALLMQRFADGGGVKGKYGYVVAYDVNGNEIGVRKNTDPPFTEEATTKPAGMYASSDAAQPGMFTSIREKEKYLEGKNKAAMTPINMARDAIGGLTDLIGMNTKPWAPSKPDMAALNKAIDEKQMPPMTDAAKAEQEAFRQANPVGSSLGSGAGVGIAQGTSFDIGPAPTLPDYKPHKTRLQAEQTRLGTPSDEKSEQRVKKFGGYDDRSPDRLKDLEAVKAGVESDREFGKWMALAQFAAGMQGKRNLAAGLAGGIERGIPMFEKSQAAYRKGMSDAADKKLKIEDAADALKRQLGTDIRGVTDKELAEARQVDKDLSALNQAEFEAAFKVWEEKNKVAREKAYIAAYGARGSGAGGYGYKDAVDDARQALDQMAKGNPIEYQKRLKSVNGDQNVLIDQLAKEFILRSGSSGTMPSAGSSPIRDSSLWGDPFLGKK